MLNDKAKEEVMFQSQYGMFTSAGDEAVSRVIDTAKNFNMSWVDTLDLIDSICTMRPAVREMRDTAVLEVIFDSIGYDENVVDFYQ
jgi:hypothetical protein